MSTTTERRKNSKSQRAPAAATGASPDTLRAQGLRTRNAILAEARKLLLEHGSLEFSLRSVAQVVGISISNLQYYFPTRQAVLRAVMEPTIVAYLDGLRSSVDAGASPGQTLRALFEQAVVFAKDVEGSSLWWHFLSLSATDAECARMFDEWYDTLTREIAQLIRAAKPDIKAMEAMHVAMVLISMADGLTIQYGAGRRRREYVRGLDASFMAAADQLLGGMLTETRQP